MKTMPIKQFIAHRQTNKNSSYYEIAVARYSMHKTLDTTSRFGTLLKIDPRT